MKFIAQHFTRGDNVFGGEKNMRLVAEFFRFGVEFLFQSLNDRRKFFIHRVLTILNRLSPIFDFFAFDFFVQRHDAVNQRFRARRAT